MFMYSDVLVFAGSLISGAIEAIAFDFGTNLIVSMFGWTLNATFAKNERRSDFSMRKAPKSVGRGVTIYASFKSAMQWLVDHSFDIIMAAFISLLFVVFVRYIFTLIWYSTKTKKLAN